MPVTTDFSKFYESFTERDDFYKVLFRPEVSVQVRELNELQTLFQRQIEKFGDVILNKGTIVSGCNFSFIDNYSYVKLKDNDTDNSQVVPSSLVGSFVENSTKLKAIVVNSFDGFESSTPDLKTIYVKYLNSGEDFSQNSFAINDILTVYDYNKGLHGINVINGGSAFSNNDTLIVLSSLVLNVSTGSISNGDYIINPITGANVQIINVDEDTLSYKDQIIVKIKPRTSDLSNASITSSAWTFSIDDSITNTSNSLAAVVENIVGYNADGRIVTNSIGKITHIVVTNAGFGYEISPTAYVKSSNNSTGINALELVPKNYKNKVVVSSEINSTGVGYAFSVTDGVIYQKGFFERVSEQTVVVSKYTPSPNNVVVGFDTIEEIIDENIDTRLKDNVFGDNYTAPGAARLKLTPILTVKTKEEAEANSEFFSLVEWADGNPYKQNQTTSFSVIGDELAKRTKEQSGNFVLDKFLVTTTTPANNSLLANSYNIVVDPGKAYIDGYRVETLRNFITTIDKGIDTEIANNQKISLNYGNYVRINKVGGLFQFSTGDTVSFYSSPKDFLSNVSLISTGNTSPVGSLLGTGRMRSMTLESGFPGDANAVYRLYLYNVKMNAGANFKNVRSVYYNGTNKGIADIVTELDPTTASNVAIIKEPNNDQLLFSAGVASLKNSNNSTYVYRTIDQTKQFSNSGVLTKSIATVTNEFYPYTGNLSSSQMKELLVVPIGNNMISYNAMTGNVLANATSSNVVGTGTTFITDFVAGDYVYVYSNATSSKIDRVVSVTNNTLLTLTSNVGLANSTAKIHRIFPKNVPIPFGNRAGLSANVDANSNILTLNLGLTIQGTASVNTAIAVNIERTGIDSEPKSANRDKFVKLRLANVTGNTVGPWCVGVPDVIRLKGVWVGNSTVNTTSKNLRDQFYIDHNQTQNYYDLSYLYKNSKSPIRLTSNSYILIQVDYATQSTSGYADTVSYLGTANSEQIYNIDSTDVEDLTSSIPTWEIPLVHTPKGKTYDLINTFDFRPRVDATVTPSSDEASAPLNPTYTLSFGNTSDPTNDKKYPLPDSVLRTDIEHYVGRKDSVIVGKDSNITILKGKATSNPRKMVEATKPNGSIKIDTFYVPPYPNFTTNDSIMLRLLLDTRVFNEKNISNRVNNHTITSIFSLYDNMKSQTSRYTMEDIGNIERRVQDLEYYVKLSLLETSVANKVIPSSIDSSLNRFKFGFFVDDFSSTNFSDLTNPQYSASFEIVGENEYGVIGKEFEIVDPTQQSLILKRKTNRIIPKKLYWGIENESDGIITPYVDYGIISQNVATLTVNTSSNTTPNTTPNTSSNTTPNTSPNTTPNNTPNTYCNNVTPTVLLGSSDNFNKHIMRVPVVMGPSNGNVTLYFNTNKFHYQDIKIYKGNTVVANSQSAVTLTPSDKNKISSNSLYNNWLLNNSYLGMYQIPANNALTFSGNNLVKGLGKISFNHNALTGNQYTITMESQNEHYIKYALEYPISVCTFANTSPPNVNTYTSIFRPALQVQTNSFGTWEATMDGFGFTYINQGLIALIYNGIGFKPNTIHRIYVANQLINKANNQSGVIDNRNIQYMPRIAADTSMFNDIIVPNTNEYEQSVYTVSGGVLSSPDGRLSFNLFIPNEYSSGIGDPLILKVSAGNESTAEVQMLLPARSYGGAFGEFSSGGG